MTVAQQRRFFFPAWADACRQLGWRMFKGRLEMNVNALNQHGRQVYAAAVERAKRGNRAATLDDLRHGCYIVALGRDRETLKLNNREVDKVTSLFKLLVNEADIGADVRLQNPHLGDRDALIAKIKRLCIPQAVIDGVCRRSFSPVYTAPFYDDLPLVNLRALVGILTEIRQREEEKRNEPF